ncbi:MAG: hypothetical protein AAFY39_08535 [Pseudomonadota bacterium]
MFDAADAATSTDLITDFIVTEDVFQLSRAVAGNTFVDFDEIENETLIFVNDQRRGGVAQYGRPCRVKRERHRLCLKGLEPP